MKNKIYHCKNSECKKDMAKNNTIFVVKSIAVFHFNRRAIEIQSL